jgi:hypothetical protein
VLGFLSPHLSKKEEEKKPTINYGDYSLQINQARFVTMAVQVSR